MKFSLAVCGNRFMTRSRLLFGRASISSISPFRRAGGEGATFSTFFNFRLSKNLKTRIKRALAVDSRSIIVFSQRLASNQGKVGVSAALLGSFRRHAVSGCRRSSWRNNAHAFRVLEYYSSLPVCKFVKHPQNPLKYRQQHVAPGGECGSIISRNTRLFNDVMFSRAFSRMHGFVLEASPFQRLCNACVTKQFDWTSWWRAVSKKVFSASSPNMQVSPMIELFLKAFSLSSTRLHVPLGITAILMGTHKVTHAQGHASSYRSSPYVFQSLLSFLELCIILVRSLYLWLLFMPSFITAPLASMFGGRFRQAWLHLVHRTLELAGAAFIKWGQWAATRPDLFPRDLCAELSKLHANAPAHNFSHTVQMVERAFGKRLSDIFSEFEERPVASGSIAQVHKATLRNAGSLDKKKGPMTVAVKVRHPGVSDVIRRDFIIINWAANLSTLIPGLKWLRLDESVRQFAVFMLTQVDLAREAAHLSRFLYNFRSWKDVSFPRPVYPLVHPAVLVETYEHGESVSNFIEFSEESHVNRRLAHIGTHTFLKMLLIDNFIHADMHPGNILVRLHRQTKEKELTKRKTSISRTQPHLVFLDVGLTAELSNKDRGTLLEFFKAVALRDGRTAAQCTLDFCSNQSCPNPEAFREELEKSFKFWGSREADVIHPGECMQELLEQVRRHKVNIDGNVCTVMVTIMVLEGWQRKLDPEFSIMQTLQNLLFKQDLAESLAYTMNGIMAP